MKINLNEPLISEDSKAIIKGNMITDNYLLEIENRRKLPEAKTYEGVNQALEEQQKLKKEQKAKIFTQDEMNPLRSMISSFSQTEQDMQFYHNSTAVHEVPSVQILKTSYYKKQPNIFACFLKSASQQFKDLTQLSEMIAIGDYKRLLRIRVRNYIALIKMLYRIYHNHQKESEMFLEFRTKLFQVKSLISALGMESYYSNLYEKIKQHLYPFSKPANNEEEKKIQVVNKSGDIESDEFADLDEENDNGYNSDEEYNSYFSSSYLNNWRQDFTRILTKEEKKWTVRAEWLEKILDLLRCDVNLINWHPWFQAKMDQLVDLDVDIKTGSKIDSSEVFYLFNFVEDQLNPFNPKTEYDSDAKIQIDKQNFYPEVNPNVKELQNTFSPVLKVWSDVRDKLCLKIKKKEEDTDYFLTVLKKKAFGNEKIYERRINSRGSTITASDLSFSDNGKYLSFAFTCESTSFNLIFSLTSQYKEPLLVKSNNIKYSGFTNHHYYCVKTNAIYKYDLQDYNKWYKQELTQQIDDQNNFFLSSDVEPSSVAYIKKLPQTDSEEPGKKQSTQSHEVYINDILCPIEQLERFGDDAIFCMNGQQNQFLVYYWNSNNLIMARYVKKKPIFSQGQAAVQMFKRENNLQFLNKDLFDIEKNLQIKVIPLKYDFLIIFYSAKSGKKKSFVFLNEQFLTNCGTEDIRQIQIDSSKEGTISSIFINEEQNSNNQQNILRFQQGKLETNTHNKQLEWTWKTFNSFIMNQPYVACFPYIYFIYNNDQVFMKDLTQTSNNGLYYMNNFLGIKKNDRPLTFYSMTYNGKLVLMVPSINSNYDSKNFIIKTHEIKTKYQQTNRYRFEGFLRYRIFAWNQDMMNVLKGWLPSVEDQQSSLDIRIVNKSNMLVVENWVGKKCTDRLIMTAYSPPFSDYRNVVSPNDYNMAERQMFYWLIILQTKKEVQVYQRNIRYSFHINYFLELEPIFVYTIDQQSEDIYDIYIDTLAKDRVDLYFIFSNGYLKRFYSQIVYGKEITSFEDDILVYSIDTHIGTTKKSDSSNQGKEGGGTAAKKVDLWENRFSGFIANKMLYCAQFIVDFTPVKPNDRIQYGYRMPNNLYSNAENIRRMILSTNEAKIVGVYKGLDDTYLRFIVSPLLNSRQLPLFNQGKFIHPVIPMVNKLGGYTQVFTLHLDNRKVDQYGTFEHMSHTKLKQKGYRFLKTIRPGLYIKFFNGIEQKIPMSDFEEEFDDILRFKQSLNGKYVVIFGTRLGSKFEDINYLKIHDLQEKQSYKGMFIYEIDFGVIKLIKSIIFADKNKKKEELEAKNKECAEIIATLGQIINQDSQFSENINQNEEKQKLIDTLNTEIQTLTKDINDTESDLKTRQEKYDKELSQFEDKYNLKKADMESLKQQKEKLQNIYLQKETYKEFVNPEIKGRQYNEFSDDYEEYYYHIGSLGYDDYKDSSSLISYNQEYVLEDLTKQLIKEKKEKEEKEEKEAKLAKEAQIAKGVKEIKEEKKEKKDEKKEWLDMTEEAKKKDEYQNMTKLKYIKENYIGFDIPYIEDLPSESISLETRESSIYYVRDEPNKQFDQSKPKYQDLGNDYLFDDKERDLIKVLQYNIHLEIGEQGDIFLIERVHNQLYYFYMNPNEKQYQLHKKTFDREFIIDSADSSQDYLIVSSKDRYQIFKLDRNQQDSTIDYKDSPLQIDYLTPQEKEKMKENNELSDLFIDSKIIIKKENEEEKKEEEKKEPSESVVQVTYGWTLENCKIKENNLLLKLSDNQGTSYFKLYDLKNKINVLYLEGSKIIISGCKQYIWNLETNQVYDVINGLSTFFIWPGDQISTPGYDSYDTFNVFEDRSIMSTLGYLQLSFNYISMTMDDALNSNFEFLDKKVLNVVTKSQYFQYMFYKIANNKSILERIFKDDQDKHEIDYKPPEPVPIAVKSEEEKANEEKAKIGKKILTEADLKKIEDEKKQVILDSQIKLLLNMLNFLTETYNIDKNNSSDITNFFFSYYFIGNAVVKDPKDPKKPGYNITKYNNIFSKLYMGPGDPRVDIIDDILHYVVMSDVPILQFVINSNFIKFLKTANTSQSFQNYLKNITKQTSPMKNIDKFQMKKMSDESTVYVDSYDSPIIDDGFYSTFRKEKEPKKDVEIYYIYLGQMLSNEGEDLMETLSDEKYLPMMDIPFIQYLVMYQWAKVKSNIQTKLLIPFIILLILFFLYATFIIDWYKDVNNQTLSILQEVEKEITLGLNQGTYNGSLTLDGVQESIQNLKGSIIYYYCYALNVIGLFGVLSYLFFMESKQFLLEPKEYFSEIWNVVDLVNYFFCLFVLLFDLFDASIQIIRPMAAVCVMILWIKLFYFLRVFETTAKLIRMIFEIVNDMKNFLIVLSIGVIGFANAFYILAQSQKDEIEPFTGDSFIKALIWSYRLALGDFQLDEFYSLYTIDIIIAWFLFVVASLFVVLVLLNLLIAIMGDTFSRVLENITNLQVREKVMLVAENESLFDRKTKFGNSQYLIVIKEKSLEAAQDNNWDGQINLLKRALMEKLTTLQTSLDDKIVDNTSEMKRRFQDFDEKTKKQSTLSETKIASTNKSEMESAFVKVSDMFESLNQKVNSQMRTIQTMDSQLVGLRITNEKLSHIQRDNHLFRQALSKKFDIQFEEEEEDEYE